jgi:heat-inducible transcriptional repressor
MQQTPALNDREKLILQAIVHTYVTTAEPVGSRTIVKRYSLGLSAATVRNVMADLESAGYLQQVHTSSGRVPTDQGYRYYVDYLMRAQELGAAERFHIEEEFSRRLGDAEDLLRHTSYLLALVSHQTGIVASPDETTAEVRRIEILPISDARVALLVADNFGGVRTSILTLDPPLDAREVPKLNAFLNEHLRGINTKRLAEALEQIMKAYVDERHQLAEDALRVVAMLPPHRGRLFLEGANQLLEEPEFRDVVKAREVFGILEEHERLGDLLRARLRDDDRVGPRVLIGLEAQSEAFHEISVVASPYRVGNEQVGMLAVLGPRRMPYPRVMAVVDYTANMLSRLLTRLAG